MTFSLLIIIFISHMITMVHNTNSNRKKRKTKKIKNKKCQGQKNTDLILLHQATHNSCIIDIITCISNIGTHLSPFLTSMSSLIKLAFALTASSILFNQLSYIHLTFDITFGLNATSAYISLSHRLLAPTTSVRSYFHTFTSLRKSALPSIEWATPQCQLFSIAL